MFRRDKTGPARRLTIHGLTNEHLTSAVLVNYLAVILLLVIYWLASLLAIYPSEFESIFF